MSENQRLLNIEYIKQGIVNDFATQAATDTSVFGQLLYDTLEKVLIKINARIEELEALVNTEEPEADVEV